jgi:hypothetical protein
MILCVVHVVSVRVSSSSKILHNHQFWSGFMPDYNCWTKYGERGVIMEDNKEEEDDNIYTRVPKYGDTAMGEDKEAISDEPADNLRRAIVNAQRLRK